MVEAEVLQVALLEGMQDMGEWHQLSVVAAVAEGTVAEEAELETKDVEEAQGEI